MRREWVGDGKGKGRGRVGEGKDVLSLAAFPDNSTISATRYSRTAAAESAGSERKAGREETHQDRPRLLVG
jgi:hypothetical protein